MSKKIRVSAGVEIIVERGRIIGAARCTDRHHAEREVREYAETKLGIEQYVGFGSWQPSSPSGWFDVTVADL